MSTSSLLRSGVLRSGLSRSSRGRRIAVSFAAGASLALLLAGCAGDPSDLIVSPSPSGSSVAPTGSATPSPDASADPSASAEPGATAVDIACDNLLTAQAIYDYNPNFGVQPDYTPADGTLPASAVSLKGTACAWVNQSSGEVIEIAVAQPGDTKLTELKNAAVSASSAVPTYGTPPQIEGYFGVVDGAGEAQLFTGEYWVIARSAYFIEPGDVTPLFDAVVAKLP